VTSSPPRARPATLPSELPPSPHRASFERFLQRDVAPDQREDVGLQGVFRERFPVISSNELASLEFVGYALEAPKHDAAECLRRGLTYVAPLKVTVRLVVWEGGGDARLVRDVKEQELYFGEVPLLTDDDVFVLDGAERTALLALRPDATATGATFLRQRAAGDHLEEAAGQGLDATLATTRKYLERSAARGEVDCLMPHDFLYPRPLVSAFRKLLAKSPLVADLDATNPLARIAHGWTVALDDDARAALADDPTAADLRPLAARLTAGDAAALVRALPLAEPDAPREALPLAREIAARGGALVLAGRPGTVHRVNDRRVWVLEDGADAPTLYPLAPPGGPRVVTALALRPTVAQGARVAAGAVLAEGAAAVDGTLALGRHCAVSYAPALAPGTCRVSARGARALRSLHLERVHVEVRDTKLGCQELARDVPGATPHALRHLDASGVVTLGAEVEPGDVLVGRVSPTNEGELADDAVRAAARGTAVGVEVFARRGRERDARHEAIVEAMKDDLRAAQEELAACLAATESTDDALHWRYDELRQRLDRGDDLAPGVIRVVRVELLVARDAERGVVLADGRGGRWVVADVADDVAAEVELPGDGDGGEVYLMKLRPEAPTQVAKQTARRAPKG
jgi:DNA-directed RNA polymerase beta subunit